ncbi:lipoprotein [Xanthomonas arboricola pv. pruni str. MAFF 311562]|uniref:Lipoprotein n=1 Tax=Xanthomonas arboricola pv. pruni str. MAFF 311562 TaxID=1414836 RepID=W4S6L0_9XANT|nr:lipoprotein [Xanthomonas arboricola pv. pruni str. MAFF 311562]
MDFVLPSLQRQLAFRVERIGDTGGERRFRLSLDAWYGAAVPSLEVRYAIADKRLLQFRGVGNLRDARGRYPHVRIVFPDTAARAVGADELRQAREQPLAKRCSAP